ncbi:hypothetical protein RRU01S_27_00590 [Agrobacterium rubi TR3 = NBRC 13261]|uniref:Uncharacterized protein n=1 Tax=Agrobacterium rubi TR3 = NBRC 13261 TaxID=1368415 RepID=A0A081D175_9HYPH|nr:hypothetical protein [Agrobacterium rubi]MBP1880500.1 hypothetical protein [Agrobacterium rubi]GAK72671.1 hypothetical protein RRU01S_27_00590 [Agrobacterium rubi TR3 = NBRC 13261]
MSQTELTLQEVLNDPLILQVMQADGISACQLLSLLSEARDHHRNTNYRDIRGSSMTASATKTDLAPKKVKTTLQHNIM